MPEHNSTESLENHNNLNDRDISDVCDGILFLLAKLEAPKNVRLLFIALLGMLAGRQTVVTFYHFDLGRRMAGTGRYLESGERKIEMARVEDLVSRTLAQMIEWRDAWGLPITYTPGGKIEGQAVASKIQTPLLAWAREVVESARLYLPEGETSERARATAFRRAVQTVLKRKRIRPQTPPERVKREQSAQAIYSTIVSCSKNYLAKLCTNPAVDTQELIHSFISGLAVQLEADFTGKGGKNAPLADAKVHGEIDFDASELPENFAVYASNSMDRKNPDSEERSTGGTHTPNLPPVPLVADDAPSPEPASIAAGAVAKSDNLSSFATLPESGKDATADSATASPLPETAENKPSGQNVYSALMAKIPVSGDHWEALQAVLSVDCPPVEYLFKDDAKKAKQAGYQVTADDFAESLSPWLQRQREIGRSFIANLGGPVIMRDDIDKATADKLLPFSFLQTESSKGNYQAWLCYAGDEPIEEIRRRFHAAADRLKLTGNLGSTHSLRWPGSINYKPGREQWRVRVHAVNLGRRVSERELEAAGLLATLPEIERAGGAPIVARSGWPGRWPDYQKCLASARVRDDGQPDRSSADYTFALTSLSWGFSPDAIAAELANLSDKAQELRERDRERYVRRTIERAAVSAASRAAA